MNIRLAKIDDLKSIVNIYNQAIYDGEKTADLTPATVNEKLNWFDEHLPDKYPIYVAEENNVVIGYLTLSPYRPGRMALRFTAEVSYYVHYEHHGKGVATLLLNHVIRKCPKLKIKNIFAILIDNNIKSIKLLNKFGFKKWGHLPSVLEINGKTLGHLYYGLKVK